MHARPYHRTIEDEENEHLQRCIEDPAYFIQAHLKVIGERRGDPQPWGPMLTTQRRVQAQLDSDRAEGRPSRIYVLKARRHRISTLIGANGFHQACFVPGTNVLVAANDQEAAGTLFAMHDVFYANLDEDMRPILGALNDKELIFDNRARATRDVLRGMGSRIAVQSAQGSGRRAGVDMEKAAGMGRAKRIDFAHLSELAFWPNGGASADALLQTIPDEPGTVVVYETTANGMGGFAYEEWYKAQDGENGFTPIFLPWYEHDFYVIEHVARNRREWAVTRDELSMFADFTQALLTQSPEAEQLARRLEIDRDEQLLVLEHRLPWSRLKWRRWAIKFRCRGELATFKQEYPATPEEAFISSGSPVFDNARVTVLMERSQRDTQLGWLVPSDPYHWNPAEDAAEDPEVVWVPADSEHPGAGAPEAEPWVDVFMPHVEGDEYLVIADSAKGYGGNADSSVGTVYNLTKHRVEAIARSNTVKPERFAQWLILLGWWYGCAEVVVEIETPGLAVLRDIERAGYPNVYQRKRWDSVNAQVVEESGWSTNNVTRDLLIDTFRSSVYEERFTCPFPVLYEECRTFARFPPTTGFGKEKFHHLKGKHDDVLMTVMIAVLLDVDAGARGGDAERIAEKKGVAKEPSVFDTPMTGKWAVDTPESLDVGSRRELTLYY